jgi:phage-related protein
MKYYYNCIFTQCAPKFIGNVVVAYELTGVCDSPFAWENPNTLVKTYSAPTNETFNFYNASAYNGYTKPIIKFVTSGTGTGVTITNVTDDTKTGNSRPFIWSTLLPLETITVDNYNESIISSTGLFRLSKFNLNFFRLVKGNNTININGDISSFTMTTSFAHAIGT